MTEVSDQIKAGMRQLIADKGQKVNFISDEPDFWGEFRVSTFGWTDYEASEHTASYGDKCHWIVPEGTLVKETSYSQFNGTFVDNEEQLGLNAAGCRCACGKYTDVTLRVTSSLGDAIQALLGYDPTTQMEL
jgi:hypothetical protein